MPRGRPQASEFVHRLRPQVASGDLLSEGYEHEGPGVCLGDGQTEAEGVPWTRRRAAPAYSPTADQPDLN